jgi:tRNA pseudouridine55 synthase
VEKKFDFLNGEVLYINKPYRWTSFDAVKKIRSVLKDATGIKKIKIGHAGTLDPLATGLLIICTGKFTKRIEEYQNLDKEYTGVITIGATTPCGDLEKEIDQTFDISNITDKDIYAAAEKLTGEIKQKAPGYSAKKINGIRAYEYARKGEDIEIKPHIVQIKEFEITGIKLPEVFFRILCSKGTYIRSIAVDLGESLGIGAHLSALCRTKIGSIKLEDALEIEGFNLKVMEDIGGLRSEV